MKIHTSGSNEFFPLKKTFILDLFQKLKSILIGTFPSWFLTPPGYLSVQLSLGWKGLFPKTPKFVDFKNKTLHNTPILFKAPSFFP